MEVRLKAGSAPYADFGVFTPFGRKASRANKYRNWVLQPNGTYLSKEVAGPSCYDTWLASWRRFVTMMIKTKGCSEPALDLYQELIARYNMLWPRCWHLLYEADDFLRSDGARHHEAAH